MLRKAFGINRGGCNDHLKVGALRQKALQIPEQKVDVDRALVRFVDDDCVVGAKERIALRFSKENAVRHKLDRCARRRMVRKSDLEAHDIAGLRFEFLGDAAGNRARGDAARLRVADPSRPTSACHEADFRQLRRFARTCFAADDDHLIFFNRLDDLGSTFRNRKPRHEFERRNRRAALGKG